MILLAACAPAPQPVAPVEGDAPLRQLVVAGYDPPGNGTGAEADALRVAEAFAEELQPGWAVSLLVGADADRGGLLRAIQRAAPEVAGPEDRFLLWFVGHGGRSVSGDRVAGSVSVADPRGGSAPVELDELVGAVAALGLPASAVVLDVCYGDPGDGSPDFAGPPVHVLTASQPGSRAWADARGGRYTRCLLGAIEAGAPGLLAAHAASLDCVEGQLPRVHAGPWPVELPLAEGRGPLLVLDRLGVLAPAAQLWIDGRRVDRRLGLHRVSGEGRTVELRLDRRRVERALEPGRPLLLTRDGAGLRAEAAGADLRPAFEDRSSSSGLRPLVPGMPSGALHAELGEGPGLLFARRDGPPRWIEAQGGPGEALRWVDRSAALAEMPAEIGNGPPVALDLDGDGLVEGCYLARDRRLRCVARGPRPTSLGPELGELNEAPLAADFDGDGVAELVATTPSGLRMWRRAGRWTVLSELGRTGASGPIGLDVDDDGDLDLLLAEGAGARAWENRLATGEGWVRQALAWAGVGAGGDPRLALRSLRGRWELLEYGREGLNRLWSPGVAAREAAAGPSLAEEGEVNGSTEADLDGDARLDLVLVNRGWQRPPHRILLQRPGGWQPLAAPALDLATDDQQLIAADFDGDGAVDLLAVNGNEAPQRPPGGCCRLLLNRQARGPVLRVDVTAAAGVELEALVAGSRRLLRLDGARSRDAAIFALPGGVLPDRLVATWPGGARIVANPADYRREGEDRRLQLRPPTAERPAILAGPWILRFGPRPSREPSGLAGEVEWAIAAGGRRFVHLLGGRTRVLDSALVLSAPGCAHARWWPSAGRIVAGCNRYGERALRVLDPAKPAWVELERPTQDLIPGGECGGSPWLARGRRELVAVDPATLRPTGRSLPAPEGSLDRHPVGGDARRCLVVDQGGGRVEVWEQDRLLRQVPVAGLAPLLIADPARGWWWVGSAEGLAAIDPDAELPVAQLRVEGSVDDAAPLPGGELAVLAHAEADSRLRLWDPDHAVWTTAPLHLGGGADTSPVRRILVLDE